MIHNPVMTPHPAAASDRRSPPPRTHRRGFSIVELLIALMISGMLLTACLVALDTMFKSYQTTSDSASTHVVSRLVMHRVLGMIRQGEEFGPYPVSVLGPTQIESDFVEFVSYYNPDTNERHVTRLERSEDPGANGLFQLRYRRWDYVDEVLVNEFSHPLLRNLIDVRFTLEYDRGPRLRRATIDLSILPEDGNRDVTALHSQLGAPVLRLIASTSPRRLD